MWFYISILIFTFLFFIFFKRYQQIQRGKHELGLNGPKPNIFFGNLLDLIKIIYFKGREFTPMVFHDYQKLYGVENLQISTTNREFIKEVFIKQFSKFVERELLTPLTDCFPIYESLLQIGKTGPHKYGWKDIRSVVSPAFTTGKMKMMHPILFERSTALVDILSKKAKEDDIIDLYEEFQALTMDVIGRTAFGVNCDALNDRNDLFYVKCRKFFNEFNMKNSFALLIGFISRPIGYLVRPFSSIYWTQLAIARNLRQVIAYRKEHMDEYQRVDLIQLLLKEDEERQKRENKPPMHIDTIVSNCFGFMLAGRLRQLDENAVSGCRVQRNAKVETAGGVFHWSNLCGRNNNQRHSDSERCNSVRARPCRSLGRKQVGKPVPV
uniref:Cytochrome P450 n=1 Tax=Panagrolaimus sp. JU765 TaxID=591449 RepID=A0AC34QP73_9BILA